MVHDLYKQPFPELDIDEHFYLREQQVRDTPAFFEYYTDPEVARYILATNPKNHQEAESEINYCRNLFHQKHGIYWTIARKDNDQMIGAVGLYINNNHHRAEICYDLSRNYWRQGIMSRAISRILDFSFYQIRLNRIEAVTMKDNVASINILLKLGFIHEGCLRNYRYYNGRSHDVQMLCITPMMFQDHLIQKQKESSQTLAVA